MAEKNFIVNGSIDIDGVTLDLTGSSVGHSIHRIGTSATPKHETPIGTVSMFAGDINVGKTNLPAGWLLCDGFEIIKTTTTYAELFAVIGTRYGETNGSGGAGTTHFRLPNTVGSFPVGHIQTNVDSPSSVNSSTASMTDHQHTFTYSGGNWGSGAGQFVDHVHGAAAGAAHSHGADAGGGKGFGTHNIAFGGITHQHTYSRGNLTSTSTGFADTNHTHVLSAANALHGHNDAIGGVAHDHLGSSAANINHSHSVTINTTDSNQTRTESSHVHTRTTLNISRVFFIIKALQVV